MDTVNGSHDSLNEGMSGMYKPVVMFDTPVAGETEDDHPEIEMGGLKKADSVEVLNISIHQCARDGDTETMGRLLGHLTGNIRKKVNVHDEDFLSALHYAARCNHYEITRMLVEKGADVSNRGDEEATPLHYAARYKRTKVSRSRLAASREAGEASGDESADASLMLDPDGGGDGPKEESVVTYLVSMGADVNAQDKYGQTPLHFAATRGNDVAAKDLLLCPLINIETIDKQKMTSLHHTAIHNNPEIAYMLLNAGASLRCIDEDGSTPLHHACSEGSFEIAVMLFKKGKQAEWVTVQDMVTDVDVDGNTCLHAAVDNGNYKLTKLCLNKNADVNTARVHHSFPLHLSAVSGDLDIMKLLVAKGARVDVLNDDMETPLHRAAAYNHVDVIQFLIESGSRVDRRDRDNYTPLLLASTYGHVASVQKLIELGANIGAKDKNDKTAIFMAAEENRLTVLKVLLAHERSIELIGESDRYDNEPLHIAAANGYLAVIRCLIEKGADIDCKNEEEQTPLHLAARYGRTNVVREIVKCEKNVVNDADEDCNTPLHLAALNGHKKAVRALLDAGAEVEARNTSLWTPLDCAAARGFDKTARILLEEDSPVDPVDKTKTTPLHLACTNGHVGVVELLLEWSADITYHDHDGNNCLDLAIEHNHEDVALAIVMSARWEEALQNETLSLKTGERQTPMRKLIMKMPDVAERVFHQCTTGSRHNPDDRNYHIYFNYTYLDDTYSNWKHGNESSSSSGSVYGEDDKVLPDVMPYSKNASVLRRNHPLYIMVTSKREDLLRHPLVTSLLHNKWSSFGRYVYYTNLLIYCIFLIFMTGYIVMVKPPFEKYGQNLTTCDFRLRSGQTQQWFPLIAKYAIMGLAVYNLLRELIQICSARLNYFGFENLVEWITYITAFLLVVDTDDCQTTTGYRYDWQWQVGAVSIFLAWINLVLFIQKFPRFGIYVVMFTDILKTFIQFFIVFFLFIIAFALGFHTLLQNQDEFDTVVAALLKTSVMMIGEFEYSTIFHTDTNTVYYRSLTLVLFVVFLILMSIIIMNLLVGLAVDDIKAVQEQAALKRLAMRVDLALGVESVLPHFFRRKFVLKTERFYPNTIASSWFRRLFHIGQTNLSSAAIENALNPELDDMEKLEKEQKLTRVDIKRLHKGVKSLEASTSRMEAMLSALVEEKGLKWEEEDLHEDDVD